MWEHLLQTKRSLPTQPQLPQLSRESHIRLCSCATTSGNARLTSPVRVEGLGYFETEQMAKAATQALLLEGTHLILKSNIGSL